MDALRRVIKTGAVCALGGWIIFLSILSFRTEIRADENSSSTTSSSSSQGQTLYDALKAIYGDSSKSSSSSSSSTTSSSSCVTIEEMMRKMETEPVGPTVTEASLDELYHEDYKVYEERLGDSYTLYTNVKNGGVTNRPVVIDVPKGVGTSMKKDGSDISFSSKKVIEDEGAYVLDLFVGDDSEGITAFSNSTFLRAKFRFRIQYGLGVEGVVGDGYEESDGLSVSGDYLDLPEDMRPDDYVYEDQMPAEPAEPAETPAETPEPSLDINLKNPLSSRYDGDTGYYINTLLTGDSFYSTLPNGSITNDGVMIQEAEGLTFTAYRNGEAYEGFTPGDYVKEGGSYAVFISKPDDQEFLKEYYSGGPAFRFRIVTGPVSDVGIVAAPEGTEIRSVRYNGLDAPAHIFMNGRTVHIDGDGDYEITFEDESGSRETALSVDTEAPVFSIGTKPNEATITYYSNDADRCLLMRGDEVISEQLVGTVTKPGKYSITVYDKAGNYSKGEFSVKYQINAAAVIAILSVLALIAGVVVYLLRMKKKVKVV